MSGNLISASKENSVDSQALCDMIAGADFSRAAAAVVGYGSMGKQYVKALRALGVGSIRVCSRSSAPLLELQGSPDIPTIDGGYERLSPPVQADELGIIAVPISLLTQAADFMADLGFKRLLIEKPVALLPGDIERLANSLESRGVKATCAYNRLAYPALFEVRARAASEGGITSCTFTFTEMIKPDWLEWYSAEELARWGIANSMHVISMAHELIGLPASWSGYRKRSLPWHPSGAVFVGSGISEKDIAFSYHADWGSTGRWSLEAHTSVSSYRLCPLEKVFRRTEALGDFTEVPFSTFAPEVKAGFAEQVAYNLGIVKEMPPLSVSLRRAADFARLGEEIFGY